METKFTKGVQVYSRFGRKEKLKTEETMKTLTIDEHTIKSISTTFEPKPIKIIDITSTEEKVTVSFENNHEAVFYKFGLDIYSVVSDNLPKSILKELKVDVESFFRGKKTLEKLKNIWL